MIGSATASRLSSPRPPAGRPSRPPPQRPRRAPSTPRTLLLALVGWCGLAGPAAAQGGGDSLEVAIGALEGKGLRDREITDYQGQLKRIEGVRIQPTSKVRKAAAKRRLKPPALRGDGPNLMAVCGDVGAGAMIFGRLEAVPGSKRDKTLVLTVHACQNGEQIGAARSVDVPRGVFKKAVWEAAARVVAEDLFAIMDGTAFRPPPPPPPPVVERRPPPPRKPPPPPEPEVERKRPLLRARVGLATLARSFSARYKAGTVQPSKEVLNYESSMVPGFAVDLEAYPLEALTTGAITGLGLGVRVEKVFLSTQAQVDDGAGNLVVQEQATNHLHALLRLMYRRALSDKPTAIELHGHLGLGWLNFETPDNADYKGASYTYLSAGGGAAIPLGTRLAVIELDAAVLPLMGGGDLATELGAEVSNFGYRFGAGLSSTLPFGLTLAALFEYTGISSTPTGAGRAGVVDPGQPDLLVGREGTEASDGYLGLRFMAGWNY